MPNANAWTTAVTEIQPNRVAVRGYDIAELMGNVSFGQAVYLILRGELPDAKVGRLMDAILVSSIDHGATPPSMLAARTVASTGGSLSQSVAAGVLSTNRWHGGAIEECARQLGRVIERAENEHKSLSENPKTPTPNPSPEDGGGESRPNLSPEDGGGGSGISRQLLEEAAVAELAELKARGERMSGFGHRFHTEDPRTMRLFELCAEVGMTGPYFDAARAVEKAFAAAGKPLPINVDGAIGVVLSELGFDPAVMNGLFMIARVPGFVAHVNEEQTRMKPMRKIDPDAHTYDGPEARSLTQS